MPKPEKPHIVFTVRVTNLNLSKVQFDNMVQWHLRLESSGLLSSMIRDCDPNVQFWQSDYNDWSPEREAEITKSVRYFANRYLRSIAVDESKLDSLVKIEVLKFEY